MPTTIEKQILVSIPAVDMVVFRAIAKKFGWKTRLEEPIKAKKSFEKSQEDIKAGRVNTYKSVDEMFKKLL